MYAYMSRIEISVFHYAAIKNLDVRANPADPLTGPVIFISIIIPNLILLSTQVNLYKNMDFSIAFRLIFFTNLIKDIFINLTLKSHLKKIFNMLR